MARSRFGVIIATALLTAAATASARRIGVGGTLQRLQLDGYIGPPAEGRVEEADLLLSCEGKNQRFQVTKGQLLGGTLLIANVYDRVRPYRPNFIVRGPKELVTRCAEAKPGDHLRVMGAWRGGSRDLYVNSVEPFKPE
jgi:hypothetical protein